MHCSMPPYTKPESAYDSARLYREASDIAAAQDAKLDAKPDALQSIMADLRTDLNRAYENAKCRIDAIASKRNLAELAQEAQAWGMYEPLAGSRIATPAELADLRRQVCRIDDVERRHPMAAEAERIAEDRF